MFIKRSTRASQGCINGLWRVSCGSKLGCLFLGVDMGLKLWWHGWESDRTKSFSLTVDHDGVFVFRDTKP